MSDPLYLEVNPISYLALAKEMKARKEAEAVRTAADRAYYAAFLTCRNVLAEKNYFIPNGDCEFPCAKSTGRL